MPKKNNKPKKDKKDKKAAEPKSQGSSPAQKEKKVVKSKKSKKKDVEEPVVEQPVASTTNENTTENDESPDVSTSERSDSKEPTKVEEDENELETPNENREEVEVEGTNGEDEEETNPQDKSVQTDSTNHIPIPITTTAPVQETLSPVRSAENPSVPVETKELNHRSDLHKTNEVTNRNDSSLDDVEEHVEEEKKKPADSPVSSEDDEDDESDHEVKQPHQHLDFTELSKSSTPKRTSKISSTEIKQKIFSLIPSSFPSFASISSSIQSLSPPKVYHTISQEIACLSSKFKTILNRPPHATTVFPTSSCDSEKSYIPSWVSQLIIHLKFLFLAFFYLHLGIWALISVFLIGINVCTLFFGPWAVFPIGGWGVGLYLHLVATSSLLQVSGASTSELSWVETPVNKAFNKLKGFTHTAYEVATKKYNEFCQSLCQQGRFGARQ